MYCHYCQLSTVSNKNQYIKNIAKGNTVHISVNCMQSYYSVQLRSPPSSILKLKHLTDVDIRPTLLLYYFTNKLNLYKHKDHMLLANILPFHAVYKFSDWMVRILSFLFILIPCSFSKLGDERQQLLNQGNILEW